MQEKGAIKSFTSELEGGLDGFKECGLFIRPDYPYLAAISSGNFYLQELWSITIGGKVPILCPQWEHTRQKGVRP